MLLIFKVGSENAKRNEKAFKEYQSKLENFKKEKMNYPLEVSCIIHNLP